MNEVLELNSELISTKSKKIVYKIMKRVFDIIMSFSLLIILLPFFMVLSLLIKIDSKGTVFYKHKRLGKNGEYIYLYKFRTMYMDADKRLKRMLKKPKIKKEWEKCYKLHNDPRITRIGKILRKTSIDEIPQIINILKGDMSLVGPRPVIDEEIKKYGDYKEKFLSVIPGLTGWWACNGRSNTTYEERINLELFYVDNCSILLDLKCILKTFVEVFKGNGAK